MSRWVGVANAGDPHRDSQLQKIRLNILGSEKGFLGPFQIPDLEVVLLAARGDQVLGAPGLFDHA